MLVNVCELYKVGGVYTNKSYCFCLWKFVKLFFFFFEKNETILLTIFRRWIMWQKKFLEIKENLIEKQKTIVSFVKKVLFFLNKINFCKNGEELL